MGIVYEAEQLSLGRRVALKVLPFAAALDAKQLQRFKNEAQAAAGLHHTNIVPVYAVGCERGLHFYAMQFIDGRTLAVVIEELRCGPVAAAPTGPFTPAPAVADTPGPAAARSTETSARDPGYFRSVAGMGVQAAEALEHAHQLGVIHRDVKPGNLLVDGQGRLWVTDFGLAHCQNQAGLTMTGDLVGTLRYMSPEQALAKRVVVDHRTDIYSLGATLYELLTLEPAFGGNDRQELLRQIAFEEPRPPRRLNRAIPGELEIIVLKAVEKNPDERYPTAQALADDLRRFLEDRPIQARRPTLWQRARKLVRRHRAVATTLAGALLTLLLVVAVGASAAFLRIDALRKTAEENADNERDARIEATQAGQKMQEARDEAEERLVRLSVTRGVQLMEGGDLLGSLPWFTEALRLERDPQRQEIHRLRLGMVEERCPKLVQICSYAGLAVNMVRSIAFSPDGRRLVLNDAYPSGRVVWDAATGQVLAPPDPDCLATSLDGRLALRIRTEARPDGTKAGPRLAQVWDTARKQPVGAPLAHEGLLLRAAFSPDGRRLLTVEMHRDVPDAWRGERLDARVWDSATGQLVLPPVKSGGERAAFSPNSRYLVTASSRPDNETRVWDLNTGSSTSLPESAGTESAQFSPDGTRLLTIQGITTAMRNTYLGRPKVVRMTILKIWDTATGRVVWGSRDSSRSYPPVREAAWSPDGSSVLMIYQDNTAFLQQVVPGWAQGGEPFSINHYSTLRLVEFGPGGFDVIAGYADGTAQVYGPGVSGPPLRHRAGVSAAAFSPDARYLVTATDDRKVYLWKLAPESWVATRQRAPAVGSRLLQAAFTGDGPNVVGLSVDVIRQGAQVDVWNLATDEQSGATLPLKGQTVGQAVLSPDGRYVVTVSAPAAANEVLLPDAVPHGEVRIWQVGATAASAAAAMLLLRDEGVARVAFSPDSRRVLTASFHDKATPQPGAQKQGKPGTGAQESVLRVWDVETGRPLSPPLAKDGWATDATFSPDGRLVALVVTSGLASVSVWDTATWQLAGPPLQRSSGLQAWFSPDGRRLVTATSSPSHLHRGPPETPAEATPGEGKAQVWDVTTGKLLFPALVQNGDVRHVAFSPDGRRLLTTGGNEAKVWDAATGRLLISPLRHTSALQPAGRSASVRHAAFSPDGRLVATAGEDNTLRVWDAATGEPLGPSLAGSGWHVAFSPDGRSLLATTIDRVVVSSLTREERPVTDLVGWAEVLTAHRTDAAGLLVPLDEERLDTTWRSLAPKAGGYLAPEPERLLAWHRRELANVWRRPPPDTRAALWHLNCLIEAVPAEPNLLVDRGDIYLGGQKEKAIADFSKAIELGGETFAAARQVQLKRGLAFVALSRHDEAIKDFTAVVSREANHWLAHVQRGMCHHWKGEYDLALRDFDTAIALQTAPLPGLLAGMNLGTTKPADVYYARGFSHVARGEYDKAIADYSEALRQGQGMNQEAVYQERGNAYTANGEYDKAIADYSEALRQVQLGSRPSDVLHTLRGAAHAAKGEYAQAIAEVGRTLDNPVELSQEAWELFVCVCLQINDSAGYRKACIDLRQRTGGSFPWATWLCALAPGGMPDPSPHLQQTERLLASFPKVYKNYSTLTALGAALYRGGQFEASIRRLNEALAAHGKGGTAHNLLFLAMAHHRLGHADEARRCLKEAGAWIERVTQTKLRDPNFPAQLQGLSWQHQVLLARPLRAEAEALLKETKP
jgi:WD40 repeat protein/tetratricopeptide (TPR) repeat protein